MAIKSNSEILFLFDAKQSNPNGDMDDENKPRMDWETETNLVSDVRLKRYIRDYLENFKGEDLFITNLGEPTKKEIDAKSKSKNKLKDKGKEPKDAIDVKMFGAVLAEKGSSSHFTGPIQFNWGYSLNKVELQETKTIVGSISEESIGKDFRVKYSFIAFSGSINSKNTGDDEFKVNLTEEDIKLFDEAMIKSIPLSRTRSKIGQTPRLYLRVELKNGNSFLKDLREFIKLDNQEELKKINSIEGAKLNCVKLGEYLKENKDIIEKIYYFKDKNLNIEGINFDESYFEELSF